MTQECHLPGDKTEDRAQDDIIFSVSCVCVDLLFYWGHRLVPKGRVALLLKNTRFATLSWEEFLEVPSFPPPENRDRSTHTAADRRKCQKVCFCY